jgi:hypothetical protein
MPHFFIHSPIFRQLFYGLSHRKRGVKKTPFLQSLDLFSLGLPDTGWPDCSRDKIIMPILGGDSINMEKSVLLMILSELAIRTVF